MNTPHARHAAALALRPPRGAAPTALAAALAACFVAAAPPVQAAPPACAGTTTRSDRPTGSTDTVRALSTWLAARPAAELDAPLLAPAEIAALNGANAGRVGTWQDVLASAPRAPALVDAELATRFEHLRERVATGAWVEGQAGSLGRALEIARTSAPAASHHLVVHPTDLRCVPEDAGLFTRPVDRDFDRNRCSVLHPGELVRVERVSRDGRWRYVHAGHGVGWLRDAALTPPLRPAEARAFRDAPHRLAALDDHLLTAGGFVLRLGVSLPVVGHADGFYQVQVPTLDGLADDFLPDSAPVALAPQPLTRRAVLTLLFARLGDVYGWGDTGGGRDCSRLLLDAFSTFGLRFGRHSGVIAESGVRTVELGHLSAMDKRAAMRRADREGIVFLYMPGHIMLYLGEHEGRPYALSALSEYLVPCPGGGDHTVRVDRVGVTTLELGRGTARTSYLERLTRLAVLAP